MRESPKDPDPLQTRFILGLLGLGLAQCCLGELIYFSGKGLSVLKSIPGAVLHNIFFCHLLLAYFLYWARHHWHPRKAGWLWLGLGTEVWFFLLRDSQPVFLRLLSVGAGLGISGALALLWEARKDRTRLIPLAALSLLPVSFMAGGLLLNSLPFFSKQVYDLHLHASDLTLYRSLTAWLSWRIHPFGLMFFQVIYELLGLAMVWIQVDFLTRPGRFRQNPILLFYLGGLLALVYYSQLPAVGSAVIFEGFPVWVPRQFSIQPLIWQGFEPRSCFPSMHVCWALSVCSVANYGGHKTQRILLLFLVGTLVSVFCVGNHYIVDVLAAFPMVVGCQGLCLWLQQRHSRLLWLSFSMLGLVWLQLVTIRDLYPFWQGKGLLLWLFFALGVASSIYLNQRFFRPCPSDGTKHPGDLPTESPRAEH